MGTPLVVRASSLNAYHSAGSSIGVPSTTTVVSSADAGVLGGNIIDLTTNSGKCLIYDGFKNAGESRAFSFLLRMKANYSGAPTALRVILQFGLGRGGLGPYLEFWHANTTGAVTVFGNNEANARTFSSASFGNWTTNVSGTEYDLVYTQQGTTTASSAKFYIDGTLLGSVTPLAALNSSWKSSYFSPITLGTGNDVAVSNYKLVEFVIWDSVIDPTNVALVGGNGSLNGASRTAFVDATNVDGSTYTDPGIANVKNGTTYTYAGVSQTGILATGGLFRNPNLGGP